MKAVGLTINFADVQVDKETTVKANSSFLLKMICSNVLQKMILEKFKKKVTVDEDGLVLNPEVDELTERTQRIVEGAHYSMREYNLKLDDVINDQRKVVYTLRDNSTRWRRHSRTIENNAIRDSRIRRL